MLGVMAHLFAQVTLPYKTNLPADVTINTFHFDGAESEAAAGDIADGIIDFYNATYATKTVSYYISDLVSRTANACSIELFYMSDAKPRIYRFRRTFTLGAPINNNMLPNEVAICSSFQGLKVSGVPQARRRGRVFIGPLSGSASDPTLAGGPRPATALRTTLALAQKQMVIDLSASDVPLCVYSRVADTLTPVASGWVDDEFDTQRRRQLLPLNRESWTIAV